ncbi:Uu.00g010120.m01.CDS01 [Anthostomella pinea]|uniref:Uu.00g010120.m01.CDS01 n=1 Tax=Anthostomella pinea TaxID=933095 RepID=A0AAI8VXI2_9PEZI|nr:Uu.00g010120.m01.CDS01 [Anthostomella pinea]
MPISQRDLDLDLHLERRESAEDRRHKTATATATSTMPSPPNLGQFPLDRPQPQPQPPHHDLRLARKLSEESIRTELCEGPVPDSPPPQTPDEDSSTACTDRAELIERLKRGESPTWIPNRHFESIWSQEPLSPTRSPKPSTATSPTLLPPPTITPEKRKGDATSDDERRHQEGLNIERPRSALHSGDFTNDESAREDSPTQDRRQARKQQELEGNGHPWLATSPPRDFTPLQFERRQPAALRSDDVRSALSSLSTISTSFAYKPPTSPLVQSESNDDIDLTSPMDGIDISSSIPRQPRRHTLMSSRTGSFGFSQSPVQRQPPSFRQERTFPYQAHQPRRSLTSTPKLSTSASSPQTPAFLRSRGPSYSSDISPIQHASMVGSYEESILRGRMSTTPSKPLDFVAQIGVLGLGKCKSSLRCPPHVTLPFPAVFYSYANSSHGRSKEDDGPSPYVGQVDLENGLPNQEEDARSKRKTQSRALDRRAADDDLPDVIDRPADTPERDARKSQRPKRRSSSPRAPPGGSYRIPEKGQIQIIIKNPNKTAVKLFLVPYDLAGMEPGTKTFVRQRSYSNGPIIENMPDSKDKAGADRPILRYLVHLHICCPSRGRYYLYKSIRVVFANRVPDGKEKLRNEITLPEPRFTAYKPIRVMHPPTSSGTGPGASLAADKAYRRRSSGFYFGSANHAFDMAEGIAPPSLPHQPYTFSFGGHHLPVEPVPFRLSSKEARRTGAETGHTKPVAGDSQSPDSSQTSRPTTQNSSNVSSWGGGGVAGVDEQIDRYNKLSKGDAGYGGNAFAGLINGNPVVAESLLSQRLRTLGVQGPHQTQEQQRDDGAMEE